MPNTTLFAKQSILDINDNLYGFEILYRNDSKNEAAYNNAKLATAELLVNYCSGLIESKAGPYVKVFINLTKNLIFSEYFFPLPPENLVIEIPKDIEIDVELLIRVSELKNNGYSFALDGYNFDPLFDDLLSIVDYIKLNIANLSPDEIKKNYQQLTNKLLSHTKTTPIIIAKKVETTENHELCRDLGFSLFQGYFLSQPKMVYGKKLEVGCQNALRLMAALQQPDITIKKVCELISQDVQLSYLIMKVVNSPICQLAKKIESLQHGITYLGLKQVKQWSMILALTGNSKATPELFRLLLERAKTCELYATQLGEPDPSISFTVGLFSGLDLVLQADKSWLLQQVGVSQKINHAILNYEGREGEIFKQVILFENGQLKELEKIGSDNYATLSSVNLEATKWASELIVMTK